MRIKTVNLRGLRLAVYVSNLERIRKILLVRGVAFRLILKMSSGMSWQVCVDMWILNQGIRSFLCVSSFSNRTLITAVRTVIRRWEFHFHSNQHLSVVFGRVEYLPVRRYKQNKWATDIKWFWQGYLSPELGIELRMWMTPTLTSNWG